MLVFPRPTTTFNSAQAKEKLESEADKPQRRDSEAESFMVNGNRCQVEAKSSIVRFRYANTQLIINLSSS